MAEAIGNEPVMIMEGGAVHRCTESALPLHFQTLNPPRQ